MKKQTNKSKIQQCKNLFKKMDIPFTELDNKAAVKIKQHTISAVQHAKEIKKNIRKLRSR